MDQQDDMLNALLILILMKQLKQHFILLIAVYLTMEQQQQA